MSDCHRALVISHGGPVRELEQHVGVARLVQRAPAREAASGQLFVDAGERRVIMSSSTASAVRGAVIRDQEAATIGTDEVAELGHEHLCDAALVEGQVGGSDLGRIERIDPRTKSRDDGCALRLMPEPLRRMRWMRWMRCGIRTASRRCTRHRPCPAGSTRTRWPTGTDSTNRATAARAPRTAVLDLTTGDDVAPAELADVQVPCLYAVTGLLGKPVSRERLRWVSGLGPIMIAPFLGRAR